MTIGVRICCLTSILCLPLTVVSSPRYAVRVDGRRIGVEELAAPNHFLTGVDAQPYYTARYEADGAHLVEIATEDSADGLRVLPLTAPVRDIRRKNHVLSFRAKAPFSISIEGETRHRALVLIADLPETDAPKEGDANVVWFGPGLHHCDEPVELRDNMTLYLAHGAVLEGPVRGVGTNITIRGRGRISGRPWPQNRGPQNGDVGGSGRVVRLTGRDIVVRDITISEGWGWHLMLDRVENARIENVRILGGRVLCDDGIDVCRSRSVRIKNCFIRTQDDCVTPKWWCEDLLVENCSLWTDVANIVRVGGECDPAPQAFRRLVFRNLDVLHQAPTRHEPEYTFHLIASNGVVLDGMDVEGVRFASRPHPSERFLLCWTGTRNVPGWSVYPTAGTIRNVRFRDVEFVPDTPPGTLGCVFVAHDEAHPVDGVSFEDLRGFVGRVETHGPVRNVRGLGELAKTHQQAKQRKGRKK